MIDVLTKACGSCSEVKPLSEFYPKSRERQRYAGTLSGVTSTCKVCDRKRSRAYAAANPEKFRNAWRRSSYRKKFGIELEDYNRLFAEQCGRCAICHRHQSELKRALAVDHSHATGMVRSLLCPSCNIGVGAFRDSPELLEAAISYLIRHERRKDG